jgi:predicted nucleotidyltransferase
VTALGHMYSDTVSQHQQNMLKLLTKYKVAFLVIGGYAMKAHGVERETRDLDLWVSRSNGNARRISNAFTPLRPVSPQGEHWAEAFMKPNRRFPYPEDGRLKEVDLLNTIAGANFGQCYSRSVEIELGGVRVRCVGLHDLVGLKQIAMQSGDDQAAHERDRRDVELLAVMFERRC